MSVCALVHSVGTPKIIGHIASTICTGLAGFISVTGDNLFAFRGDRKVWYGIAGDDGDRFEKAMEEFVPELFEKQPDLLHHIVTMINPRLLMEKGINVCVEI